jgi:hypothetical protein
MAQGEVFKDEITTTADGRYEASKDREDVEPFPVARLATECQTYQGKRDLIDLRDLDVRGKKGGDFRLRIQALREAQSSKRSFLDRLKKEGL